MRLLAAALLACALVVPGEACAQILVGPSRPHATISSALAAARDGDTILVAAGSYSESLATAAPGVTLRAEGEVTVTTTGRVLHVQHPRITVEGFVFDGGYGDSDAVRIENEGDDLLLRRVEVRRSGRDCIDMAGPTNVRIESSLVHHCLWANAPDCASEACREDAHGIVGGPVQGLTIVDTEVHTFSGDAIQLDPGRTAPIWTDVRIERCFFWVAPLPGAENGFAAGVTPGENAIDTKTPDGQPASARLDVVDTVASGFRGGLITNMAAFNLKENVLATLDRVSVHDSEIAFRLRGRTSSRPDGARVTIDNAVVWDVDTAVRYEDDLEPVTLRHATFGGAIGQHFDQASAPSGVIAASDVLVLGATLPAEAMGPGSLAVDTSAFEDAAGHDYRLAAGSAAIDRAMGPALSYDRLGIARPQGAASDVGAYERCDGACPTADAGPPPGRDAALPSGDAAAADATSPRPDGAASDGGLAPVDGGCGCRVGRPRGFAAAWFVGLLVFARRRRHAAAEARSVASSSVLE